MTSKSITVNMIKLTGNKVVDMLIFLKLYKNSLTVENIANIMLTALTIFDFEAKYCRMIIMDTAVKSSKLLNSTKELFNATES